MPGPWVTIPEVTRRVADVLSKDVDALDPKWASLIDDALAAATTEILGAMLARGYAPAQVDAWDRRREFTIHLVKFWALTEGALLANYTDAMLAKVDRRGELAEVNFTINGVLVQPGSAQSVATPAVGRLSEAGYRGVRFDTEY